MSKQIYILKGEVFEAYDDFKDRMFALAETILDQFKPDTLKVSMTIQGPPRLSVIPFRKEKIAVFSICGTQTGDPELIHGSPGFTGAYRVEEAIPVVYEKSWADREPTPGVCLLTLFHRKPDLEPDSFLSRWHDGHTPLSLQLHPLWNYNRNVVLEKLTPSSDWYDGIVEEQFRTASDLLNPLIFFGPPLRVPIHMYQVYKDTNSFIDMKRIETYLATEYHFKS